MPFSKNNKIKEKRFLNKWLDNFPKNTHSQGDNIYPQTALGKVTVANKTLQIDCLANDPDVYRINDILSPEECQHFIDISQKRFIRSPVAVADGTNSNARTSSSAFLNKEEDPVVKKLEDRISQLLKIDKRQIEPLQIVHYVPGQKYDYHTDWFDKNHPHEATQITKEMGGQREYTILIYLNDLLEEDLVKDNGSTCFQQANICAKPKRGSGVFWKNLENGEVTHNSYHAGIAPEVSEKYAINVWTREGFFPALR